MSAIALRATGAASHSRCGERLASSAPLFGLRVRGALSTDTLRFTAHVTGGKPGDATCLKLSGPGLPPGTEGAPRDASGASTTVVGTVGPVTGTSAWFVAVDQIAGSAMVNGPSSVTGFCPST